MKILVVSPLDGSALAALEADHDVLRELNPAPARFAELIIDREVLVLRSGAVASAEVMEAAPDLQLVLRAGSGLDNIDVAYARARGVRVVRVPGMSAPPVAEMTFALMLSLARKVVLADRLLRAGHWPKADLGGPLMRGRTLGIIGAGNIGGLVGEMGRAWGMRVLGCTADRRPEGHQALRDRGIELVSFNQVVREADVLSLHVPLDDGTRHLVDADVLGRMKPGSFLINMARGGVVDEKALEEALTLGETLVGAALDVHESEGEGTLSPLAGFDNVVLTPHIGAMALDAQRLIGERLLTLLSAFTNQQLDQEASHDELVC